MSIEYKSITSTLAPPHTYSQNEGYWAGVSSDSKKSTSSSTVRGRLLGPLPAMLPASPLQIFHISSRVHRTCHHAAYALSTLQYVLVRAVTLDAEALCPSARPSCKHILCLRIVVAVRRFHRKTLLRLSAFQRDLNRTLRSPFSGFESNDVALSSILMRTSRAPF